MTRNNADFESSASSAKMTSMMKRVHAHLLDVSHGFENRRTEGEVVDSMGGYIDRRKEVPILNALESLRQGGHIKHSDDLPIEHGVSLGEVWVPVPGEDTDLAAAKRRKWGIE